MYTNADLKLHSVNCENREYYAGICEAIKQVKDLEDYVEKELN